MKILVTGGAGFIGSTFSRFAKGVLDWDIVVVDKLTYAGHQSSLAPIADRPGYVFVRADICDSTAMNEILARHRPDGIVHLAAETHVDRSIDGARGFIETNILGTFTLLEAVRGYCRTLPASQREQFRFLHVSTDEVYGSLREGGLFTEDSPYGPRSPYSATKASSDHLVRAWGHTYGLSVIVANCSNNYGPYQLPEKLIPLAILNGLEGLTIPVYGDGGNIRDWLHVEDHAEALVLILAKGTPGESYNVGGHNARTNLSVIEQICDLLDAAAPSPAPRRSLIAFVADRPGHDRRYAIDAKKLETQLDWRPRHGFAEGLKQTVEWYLANGDWWRPLREAGIGKRRLGLSAGDEPR